MLLTEISIRVLIYLYVHVMITMSIVILTVKPLVESRRLFTNSLRFEVLNLGTNSVTNDAYLVRHTIPIQVYFSARQPLQLSGFKLGIFYAMGIRELNSGPLRRTIRAALVASYARQT